jgi:hypothetical protein
MLASTTLQPYNRYSHAGFYYPTTLQPRQPCWLLQPYTHPATFSLLQPYNRRHQAATTATRAHRRRTGNCRERLPHRQLQGAVAAPATAGERLPHRQLQGAVAAPATAGSGCRSAN